MLRAIVIAAGEATRWDNHLGLPKHFAPVDDEPIIERTVRLLLENGVNDIFIVANDDRYFIEGSWLYDPELDPQNGDADKFLSSKELWVDVGRTVVLYGDVFFTERAMRTIINHNKREWTLFCRPEGSDITGTRWGECFAQSFYEEHQKQHYEALLRLVRLYQNGTLNRCGGWEHYRAMLGFPDDKLRKPHVVTTNYVEINDFTEDFDFPSDYDNFIERWNARKETKL